VSRFELTAPDDAPRRRVRVPRDAWLPGALRGGRREAAARSSRAEPSRAWSRHAGRFSDGLGLPEPEPQVARQEPQRRPAGAGGDLKDAHTLRSRIGVHPAG
jgi:hypothetical protein